MNSQHIYHRSLKLMNTKTFEVPWKWAPKLPRVPRWLWSSLADAILTGVCITIKTFDDAARGEENCSFYDNRPRYPTTNGFLLERGNRRQCFLLKLQYTSTIRWKVRGVIVTTCRYNNEFPGRRNLRLNCRLRFNTVKYLSNKSQHSLYLSTFVQLSRTRTPRLNEHFLLSVDETH